MGPPPHNHHHSRHNHQSHSAWTAFRRRRRRNIVWWMRPQFFVLVICFVAADFLTTATTAAATTTTTPAIPSSSRRKQLHSPLAFIVGENSQKRTPRATTAAQRRRKCNHASCLFLVSSTTSAFPTTTWASTSQTKTTMRRRARRRWMIQNNKSRRRRLQHLQLSVPDDVYDPDYEYDPLLVVKPAASDNDDNDDEEEDSKRGLNNVVSDAAATTVSTHELFFKVQEQQKQIDQLLNILTDRSTSPLSVHSSSSSSSPLAPPPQRSFVANDAVHGAVVLPTTTTTTVGVVPVKAMLFIDGTWLYYSIHEREPHLCPIIQKFGHGWQNRYRIDWAALPRILCESLQDPGWSGTTTTTTMATTATTTAAAAAAAAAATEQYHDAARTSTSPRTAPPPTASGTSARRPMEIIQVQVFTSYKSDTLPSSWRYRMYEDMKGANYDVFQKETVGKSEKCVDIQLAVDMLHYATVPNAYDVALILTGDKDFMPAMIRTRQKGRKVALVSMKRGCNKALFETPNIKDYDVIWLEDHLDKWIVPIDGSELSSVNGDGLSQVSLFTIAKVIYDFIDKSGLDRVSSRDIGRYLKYLRLGNDEPLLEHVKFMYRGLKQMIHTSGMFYSSEVDNNPYVVDKDDKSYWVGCRANVKEKLLQEARKTSLSKQEKAFFGLYSTALLKDKRTAYHHTLQLIPGADSMLQLVNDHQDRNYNDSKAAASTEINTNNFELPEELSKDYSKCTVAQLKERCRERNLPVGGVKADLLERVQNDVQDEIAKLKLEHSATTITTTATNTNTMSGSSQSQAWLTGFAPPDESVSTHLKGLVVEYVKARGGSASSRDVGRYLAANKSSKGGSNSSALQELKTAYGGLAYFLNWNSDTFGRTDCDGADKNNKYAFQITLHAA